MSVDKDFVLNALLRHNYLPTQKEDREELPPIFSSRSFSPEVACELVKAKQRNGSHGYDAVEYKATRFNGVSRNLSIPHPVAHARLSLCIHENWEHLEYVARNKNSLIRPRQHEDGRLVIMDYENSLEKAHKSAQMTFGRRFMVHTDIANCFPSIYSHAVPWATVGFAYAKTHKPPKYRNEWFNQLDEKLRWTKRNETQGIAIGPATSNVVLEAVLARVDEALKEDFEFVRFIDDYTAYCHTEDEAQEFVRRLSEELARYKLLLNINKTAILPLPQATASAWVSDLALLLPTKDEISGYDAVHYLNHAVLLGKQTPDGSVLKYGVKTILRRPLAFRAEFDLLPYVLNLSYHQPILLPLLSKLFEKTLLPGAFQHGKELQGIAIENARLHRSDGTCWALYYMNTYGVEIDDELAKHVIESRDCLALLLVYLSGQPKHQGRVIEVANGLDSTDLYELDQYWLLLYHLFLDGQISNPYPDEEAFTVLKGSGVSFLAGTVV